jgi:hypothetical protein
MYLPAAGLPLDTWQCRSPEFLRDVAPAERLFQLLRAGRADAAMSLLAERNHPA